VQFVNNVYLAISSYVILHCFNNQFGICKGHADEISHQVFIANIEFLMEKLANFHSRENFMVYSTSPLGNQFLSKNVVEIQLLINHLCKHYLG
jgi:hypothetical protein